MAFEAPTEDFARVVESSVRIERVAPSGKIARKLAVSIRDTEENVAAMREMALRQFVALDAEISRMEGTP
jgi:hypothetical protein